MVKAGKEGKVYSDYNDYAPHQVCWDLLLGTQPHARSLQEGLTPHAPVQSSPHFSAGTPVRSGPPQGYRRVQSHEQLGSLIAAPPGLVCSDNHILERALPQAPCLPVSSFLSLSLSFPKQGRIPFFCTPSTTLKLAIANTPNPQPQDQTQATSIKQLLHSL